MKYQIQAVPDHPGGADYTLLLKRLEKIVIRNDGNEKCRMILQRKDIWKRLSPGQAVKWAGLTRIAGLVDTGLEIYELLINKFPDYEAAWKEYIELLDMLDQKQSLVSVVKRAERNFSKRLVHGWMRQDVISGSSRVQADFAGAADPFIEMQIRQESVTDYLSLFSGRPDVFARQWADKKTGKSGYVPVRRPIGISDVEDHLKGLKTYGFYLMDKNAHVRCAVIDADLVSEFRNTKKDAGIVRQLKKEQSYMISRIKESSGILELNPVIEVSGYKGFHFWYFFNKPVPAFAIRKALIEIALSLKQDPSFFDLEVFPKQDHLTGKGFGNLVKFPLGVHRLTGKRSFFPACQKKDTTSQLGYLKNVKKSGAEAVRAALEKTISHNIVIHPKMEAMSKKYPGLFELDSYQCRWYRRGCCYWWR